MSLQRGICLYEAHLTLGLTHTPTPCSLTAPLVQLQEGGLRHNNQSSASSSSSSEIDEPRKNVSQSRIPQRFSHPSGSEIAPPPPGSLPMATAAKEEDVQSYARGGSFASRQHPPPLPPPADISTLALWMFTPRVRGRFCPAEQLPFRKNRFTKPPGEAQNDPKFLQSPTRK